MRRRVLFVVCGLGALSVAAYAADGLNTIAEKYAHLVLALGQHDPDYVDAFYGPAEWKTDAEKEKKSLEQIAAEAAKLMVDRTLAARALVDSASGGKSKDELTELRREYLEKRFRRSPRAFGC